MYCRKLKPFGTMYGHQTHGVKPLSRVGELTKVSVVAKSN
jgi:hypothetical protein